MKKIIYIFALSFAMSEVSQAQSVTIIPNASGNVGIATGISTIQNKLQIGSPTTPAFSGNDIAIGNASGGGMSFSQFAAAATGASIWYSNANFALMPAYAGTGKVGIGNLAPANRLQIGPNNAFSSNDIAIGNAAGGGMSFLQSGAEISGNSIWYSNANFAMMPAGAGTGKFGIGTLTPAEKLTVQTATNYFGLFHTDGTTSVGTYVSSTRAYLGTKSNHDLGFFTNDGTTQMIIKTSGNVGIGTAGPTAKLHVDGYTKLGNDAPAIKTKKFTGTTAATQNVNATPIVHGLTASKILSISVVVDLGGAGNVSENYTQTAGYQIGMSFENTNIYIWNSPANSANILNKPFKVLVTYEE